MPFPFDVISKNIILLKYLFIWRGKKKKKKVVSFQFLEGEILHCISHLTWAGIFVGTDSRLNEA